ncbi:GMC family oxidoreductase [Rhodococcus tibetensis]|uniref:GMC family oxidoreductase N-terminal domain-containing protein n=1 Tax=Rhodococcus tibetensis TaxID=2965064 RepID=A0ABT1QJ54_9NOCA|nr:GMC family oxidoreductase N-terminal domain-containing protein [Rhodococcus sp. FXJ9.536]MCQ4122329.1 GMC family oxidoreductase N-terminal domain-containing protein [Rhodococcus sp. FXJ9.536]
MPNSSAIAAADVVVIGAGSAGSVVVRRLLDAGMQVTVIEGGPVDSKPEIHDPLGSIGLWASEVDWDYQTVPQPFANGQTIPQPRGKTLGGSSAFNGMIYVRGSAADYDMWSMLGAAGWDWNSVEPYFRKLEDFEGGTDGGRGIGGPLHIQRNPAVNELTKCWVEAAEQAGFPYNADYNSGSSEGVSYTQHTIKDGRRFTSWVGYVRPIEDHPNLTVITETLVSELTFDGTRVIGVNFIKDGVAQTITADREVVLAAGTLGTPAILNRSGIGAPNELAPLGIVVKADLPGVGKNLQDHFSSPIIWETHGEIPPAGAQALEAQIFAKSRPGIAVPDLQPLLMNFVYPFIAGDLPEHGFTAVSQILHPLSRGEVRLRSAHPDAAPLIDSRVFSEPADLEAMIDNMDLLREVASQPAITKWIKEEARPGKDATTRAEMREYVRTTTVSGHHQVGTAKMGVDSMSVVDPQLRVHGIEGLRVADASVMPTIITGNTNAPAIMIGERAADFIINDNGSAK